MTTTTSKKVSRVYLTIEGEQYLERNCWKDAKHEPHDWKTWAFADGGEAAWCDGSGNVPEPVFPASSTSTWAPKKMKDFRPMRADCSVPMTLHDANKIACAMHAEDLDKSGEPYSRHLHAVRKGVQVLGGTVDEQIAALFHDSVEDGHTTLKYLRSLGCSEETVKIVAAVSKEWGEEQNHYLERIIVAGPGAMRVKVADLLHNLRHDRMADVKRLKGEATYDRLLKKYRPALARLLMELSLIVDESEQKKLATKPVGTATGGYTGGYAGGTYGGSTAPSTYAVDALLAGDWPVNFPAPILVKIPQRQTPVDRTDYLLANGQVVRVQHYAKGAKAKRLVKTYPFYSWSHNPQAEVVQGLDKTLISNFRDQVKDAKDHKDTYDDMIMRK